jgi:hypothetical protein
MSGVAVEEDVSMSPVASNAEDDVSMSVVSSVAALFGKCRLTDMPIGCPSCGDHFRGTDYASQSRFNPFTLNCCHTFCRACTEAMEGARTETDVPVCHVCRVHVTSAVLNQGIADFAEAVYVGNGWSNDDALEDAPPRVRPARGNGTASNERAAELGRRCRYAAQKMREAHARAIVAKAQLRARLEETITQSISSLNELQVAIVETRDDTIARAEALSVERTALLMAQVCELREAAAAVRAGCERAKCVIASDDSAAAKKSARADLLALLPLTQLCTEPVVDPIAGCYADVQPVFDAIERETDIITSVDDARISVSGPGITGFVHGATEAAAAHNVIDVVCEAARDNKPVPFSTTDFFVSVSCTDDTMSAQELDAGIEFNVAQMSDDTARITYTVKNSAIKTFLLHVNMFHAPLGSPFTLCALDA